MIYYLTILVAQKIDQIYQIIVIFYVIREYTENCNDNTRQLPRITNPG